MHGGFVFSLIGFQRCAICTYKKRSFPEMVYLESSLPPEKSKANGLFSQPPKRLFGKDRNKILLSD